MAVLHPNFQPLYTSKVIVLLLLMIGIKLLRGSIQRKQLPYSLKKYFDNFARVFKEIDLPQIQCFAFSLLYKQQCEKDSLHRNQYKINIPSD